MIIRETQRLILREWKESDRDLFREINADEKVMEFFPFRRSHAEADAVLETINGMIRGSGYGFYAMELRETGEVMVCLMTYAAAAGYELGFIGNEKVAAPD